MQVAFWELAPYFPGVKVEDLSEAYMSEFIRENAGKAFEFMVDKVPPALQKPVHLPALALRLSMCGG